MTRSSDTAPAWQQDARCAQPAYADKDLWWRKSDHTAVREAKRVCWECPVIQTCLMWALANEEDRGLWGGLTEDERRRLHGRKPRKKDSVSGQRARSSKAA